MIRRVIPIAGLALALTACGTGPGSADRPLAEGDGELPEYAQAGGGAFPSCYEEVAFDEPAPELQRELFVLIDQTTPLDPRLVESLNDKVADYLEADGTKISIASFSANTAGNFAAMSFSGASDSAFDESRRGSVNSRKLALLDECLANAPRYLAARAEAEMQGLVRTDSGDYANSEVIGSLATLSEAVRASTAPERTVLVVSDLLEHSSTTSFYADRQIRDFDLQTELQKVADRRQFGDFGGARVYVMGAGIMPPEAEANATRDAAKLASLREFWENWFSNSNAQLAGYGSPQLLVDLQ